MYSHVAKDFLVGLAFFNPNSSGETIAADPAELRVVALAAQVFAFLDAYGTVDGDVAPQTESRREQPLAA
jgi:hypothetical protein